MGDRSHIVDHVLRGRIINAVHNSSRLLGGLDGVDIGDALSSILERVIDGELPNDKEFLTKELKRLSEDKSAKS